MTTNEWKDIYKETAMLRNLDDLIKIQKFFNYFESKNINIQSRWIQHYYTSKNNHEKTSTTSPILNGSITPKFDFMKINSEYIQKLDENDPIK